MCIKPRKYIENVIDAYQRLFGEKPSNKVQSPLGHSDLSVIDWCNAISSVFGSL